MLWAVIVSRSAALTFSNADECISVKVIRASVIKVKK